MKTCQCLPTRLIDYDVNTKINTMQLKKNKEAVVYIHNAILLSHKKEHVWVCSKEVDKPRSYYIEWNESERER